MKRLTKIVDKGANVHGKISRKLYEEILPKLKKIADNPRCYDNRLALVKESLRSIGDVYSFWIENPELRMLFLTQNKQEDTMKKEAQRGIQAVHNAWYFLSKQGDYGSFVNILDEEILKSANNLITGGNKDNGHFRTFDVTLNYQNYTPPSFEKVPELVNASLECIKDLNGINPLEAGIYAHLSFALIQPFGAGNKRTARIMQDRILDNAGLPPAMISAGEGKYYFDLLGRTAPAWRDGNSEGQKEFYDYVASKVNNGLDEILDDLRVGSEKIQEGS